MIIPIVNFTLQIYRGRGPVENGKSMRLALGPRKGNFG
jgi:hypothetical protein